MLSNFQKRWKVSEKVPDVVRFLDALHRHHLLLFCHFLQSQTKQEKCATTQYKVRIRKKVAQFSNLVFFSFSGKAGGATNTAKQSNPAHSAQRREDIRLTKMMLTIFLCFLVSYQIFLQILQTSSIQ